MSFLMNYVISQGSFPKFRDLPVMPHLTAGSACGMVICKSGRRVSPESRAITIVWCIPARHGRGSGCVAIGRRGQGSPRQHAAYPHPSCL